MSIFQEEIQEKRNREENLKILKKVFRKTCEKNWKDLNDIPEVKLATYYKDFNIPESNFGYLDNRENISERLMINSKFSIFVTIIDRNIYLKITPSSRGQIRGVKFKSVDFDKQTEEKCEKALKMLVDLILND